MWLFELHFARAPEKANEYFENARKEYASIDAEAVRNKAIASLDAVRLSPASQPPCLILRCGRTHRKPRASEVVCWSAAGRRCWQGLQTLNGALGVVGCVVHPCPYLRRCSMRTNSSADRHPRSSQVSRPVGHLGDPCYLDLLTPCAIAIEGSARHAERDPKHNKTFPHPFAYSEKSSKTLVSLLVSLRSVIRPSPCNSRLKAPSSLLPNSAVVVLHTGIAVSTSKQP